jgi:sugar phosphate isomerase/epimerase
MEYSLAVKRTVLLTLALSTALAVPALAQRGRPQIGVCLDAAKLQDAQAAGFDYVEIGASKVAAMTDEEFRDLARQASQLRVPVAAANLFVPGTLKLVGPEVDKPRQAAYVALCLGRLKTLGVSVLVFGSGGARRVPDGFSRDEAFAQLVDFCRRVAPVARENGITIVIEPLRRQETNIINTAREGLALARAVDRPEIRLLVDYYHLAEESESPDVLLEAAPFLAHVHVANPKGRVYPLAADESAYGPFFANLCKIGYAGRVSVEASTTDYAADAPKSLALMRTLRACGGK